MAYPPPPPQIPIAYPEGQIPMAYPAPPRIPIAYPSVGNRQISEINESHILSPYRSIESRPRQFIESRSYQPIDIESKSYSVPIEEFLKPDTLEEFNKYNRDLERKDFVSHKSKNQEIDQVFDQALKTANENNERLERLIRQVKKENEELPKTKEALKQQAEKIINSLRQKHKEQENVIQKLEVKSAELKARQDIENIKDEAIGEIPVPLTGPSIEPPKPPYPFKPVMYDRSELSLLTPELYETNRPLYDTISFYEKKMDDTRSKLENLLGASKPQSRRYKDKDDPQIKQLMSRYDYLKNELENIIQK